jgi:hypothetical protein
MDMRIAERPDNMSKEQFHAMKAANRRLRDEIMREGKLDTKLKFNNSTWVLEHRISRMAFRCYCTGEGIRNGRVCKICKLSKKVDDYMLNLFKDAAEGR